MYPEAVLFDLDGTLVDTAPDLIDATNQLRTEHGKTCLADETVRAEVSRGGAALTRLALGKQATPTDHVRLLTLYEASLGRRSQVFAGLRKALEYMDVQSIKWGIVTNKERRFTLPLLQQLNLMPAALVCGDDLAVSKPDPEPLLHAARILSVIPGKCWYIGDHQRDIEAAERAGMVSVAATYGYIGDKDDPASWQATLAFASPLALAQALMALPHS